MDTWARGGRARAVGAQTARTGVLSLLQLLHNLHHLRRGWGRSHVARGLEARAGAARGAMPRTFVKPSPPFDMVRLRRTQCADSERCKTRSESGLGVVESSHSGLKIRAPAPFRNPRYPSMLGHLSGDSQRTFRRSHRVPPPRNSPRSTRDALVGQLRSLGCAGRRDRARGSTRDGRLGRSLGRHSLG